MTARKLLQWLILENEHTTAFNSRHFFKAVKRLWLQISVFITPINKSKPNLLSHTYFDVTRPVSIDNYLEPVSKDILCPCREKQKSLNSLRSTINRLNQGLINLLRFISGGITTKIRWQQAINREPLVKNNILGKT